MTDWMAEPVRLLAALVVGWAVPALGMRVFVPTLEASGPRLRNYRDVDVFIGLGTVWVFWVIAVVGLNAVAVFGVFFGGELAAPVVFQAVPVVVAAFVFGLIDDAFGGSAEKGFGGHLRALMRGRLTTGGLKLLGIGVASLGVALVLELSRAGEPGATPVWRTAVAVAAATGIIALSANFVNLLDVRPARAIKAHAALSLIVAGVAVARAIQLDFSAGASLVEGVGLLVMMIGPMAAVWRWDAGGRGVLGDAGANAAGALAGFMLAAVLPLLGQVVAAAVLLGINLLSERVSFSAVIERNRVLAWADGLGRMPEMTEDRPSS
ncbi:MAG: hypothetical protein U1E22_03855 [Coriobacteriia bacterium]|nr:hypothetical protein [Coriobacteriia bacterium]